MIVISFARTFCHLTPTREPGKAGPA